MKLREWVENRLRLYKSDEEDSDLPVSLPRFLGMEPEEYDFWKKNGIFPDSFIRAKLPAVLAKSRK